jgi:hypothetical protein
MADHRRHSSRLFPITGAFMFGWRTFEMDRVGFAALRDRYGTARDRDGRLRQRPDRHREREPPSAAFHDCLARPDKGIP